MLSVTKEEEAGKERTFLFPQECSVEGRTAF
jgi:hypothetical protein